MSGAGSNNRPHSLLPWCFTFCTLAHIHGWKHQCLAIAHVLYTHTQQHTHLSTSHTHLQLLSITVLHLYSYVHWLAPSLLPYVCTVNIFSRDHLCKRDFAVVTHIWFHHGGPFETFKEIIITRILQFWPSFLQIMISFPHSILFHGANI